MDEKVLLVDDEADILETFRRSLRKKFRVEVALGPEKGLEAVSTNGPYAVIVSDMRMPGMDGIQFLSRVKETAPDSVRVMLTGNTDIDTAMGAVNEGSIFHFLTKPCPPEVFEKTLAAGIRQYRLVTAERELLEKTLSRSVKVLIDILSMVNPLAFSKAMRLRRYTRHIIEKLRLSNRWQYELAAMLSQIGCVKLAPETLEKIYVGQELTEKEEEAFASHPSVGANLLRTIPRLEKVAGMIEKQMAPFSQFSTAMDIDKIDPVEVGAQILKVTLHFDKLVTGGRSRDDAVEDLLKHPDEYNPLIALTMRELKMERKERRIKLVGVEDLTIDMAIAEDVWTTTGLLLLPKGQDITYLLLERLKNFSRQGVVPDKIRVLAPAYDATSGGGDQ